VSVSGSCQDRFEPLRELLAQNLADGTDLGASVAVVHDGELVVDLWGGEARPGEPWVEDTLVMVWSVSKTMAALTTLVLVDRGDLDLDAPVASYWPGFASPDVLVRHLLSHTSGYAGWSEPLDVPGLLDLERSEAALAAQQPWWPPGQGSGYHMISYGHLLDGLVRGATGVPLAEQFRTLVAEPLGADFHLGAGEDVLARVADLVPPTTSALDVAALPEGNLLIATITNPLLSEPDFNGAAFRGAGLGGVGGLGNARSIARIQSALSHGGAVDGVRLLSERTLGRVFDVQADGLDRVLAVPTTWGTGYALPNPAAGPAVPTGRVCWWTGWGGSIVVNDVDRRTTFAYAMNRMEDHVTSSPRTDAYVRTAFGCLDPS
jgi:CubicO group peptidase (beta-lactamase class C family)